MRPCWGNHGLPQEGLIRGFAPYASAEVVVGPSQAPPRRVQNGMRASPELDGLCSALSRCSHDDTLEDDEEWDKGVQQEF